MSSGDGDGAMFSLHERIAVVTGAGSGLGLAIAQRLARAGAHVVIADIADAEDEARAVGGTYVRTDVAHERDVKALVSACVQRFGRFDIYVNNAGISHGAEGPHPLARTERRHLERLFEVNTLGVFFGLKHAGAAIADGGSIVNIASIVGPVGFPGYTDYAVSKLGVVALTRIGALELGARGVRVNCICPTAVKTPMLARNRIGSAESTVFDVASPLSTELRPSHVAALVHSLASDDCAPITGQAIMLDRGLTSGVASGIWQLAAGVDPGV